MKARLAPITCKTARTKLALSIDGIRTCDISISSPEQYTRACLIRSALNCHASLVAAVIAYEKAVAAGIDADPELWRDAALKGQAALKDAGVLT